MNYLGPKASRLADLLRDGWCKYEELTDRTFCDSAIPIETAAAVVDALKNYE